MGKFAFYLVIYLGGAAACAQDAFYITETHNEYTYPVVVPYPDEQSARTLDKRTSPFYREITGEFGARNPPVKTTAADGKQAASRGEASVYAVIDLPESWRNREKVIAFRAQKQSFTLLINGREVTRIEKEIPVQFNVTPLLKEKDNRIELRFAGSDAYKAGLLNSVSLVAAPTVHLIEVGFGEIYHPMPQTDLNWIESLTVKNYAAPPYRSNHTYLTRFYDQSHNLVKTTDNRYEGPKPLEQGKTRRLHTGYSIGNFFNRWTGETPHLYRYTLEVSNPAKETVEVLSGNAGFRSVSIHDNQLSLSSVPLPVPIALKPVLYGLPASVDSLHSEAVMRPALAALKAHNVNTVVISGYPAGSLLYDLCDELGLYVVQKIDPIRPEALQKLTLDGRAEELRKERSKIMAAALHLEDHPCVIALYLNKNYSPGLADKLLLNAINGLVSITAYKDRLVFMHKAFEVTLPLDWYRLPDWNKLTAPQRAELKKQYQYALFRVKDPSGKELHLTNGYDFIGLDGLVLQWQIREKGKTVREGQITDLAVLPKKSLAIHLPFSFQDYKSREGCVFRFSLNRKEGNAWAPQGQEVAWEEFTFVRSGQGLLLLSTQDLLNK